MDKDKLKIIIEKHPNSFSKLLKINYEDFYNFLVKTYNKTKFSETVYLYLYGESKCNVCNKDVRFISLFKGYSKFCSKKCSNNYNKESRKLSRRNTMRDRYHVLKKCINCDEEFDSLKSRNQNCCSNTCSNQYIARNNDRISKIKKTKFEKYGDEFYTNQNKRIETNLKRYGVEHVGSSDTIKDKIKKTNLKNHGCESYIESEEFKEKSEKTILDRYGVKVYSQSEDFKQKVSDTVKERYGVKNVFSAEEIKSKIKRTNLKKHGVPFPSQNVDIQRKISNSTKNLNYKNIISRILKLTNVEPLFDISEYIDTGRNNRYKFKCKTCNTLFDDHIDDGHFPRCLVCHPVLIGTSNIENEVVDFIKSISSTNIIIKDRSILGGKELDIYIPEKNIAIEVNGLYWHSETSGKKSKKYHVEKTNLCKDKNIQLIHIFEDEWVTKENLIKQKLTYILNGNRTKSIYARKCIIKPIENCKDFLEETHIQGNCPSKIKLGAFYQGELVAVMTFSNPRGALGKKEVSDNKYELLRFSTKYKVVGIASKLFKFFQQYYNPEYVITYADRRYSVGNLYKKMGFEYKGETKPSYWYFKIGYLKRYHRYNFAKHTLLKKLNNYEESLTEWQNMQINGYDRIWDCGNMKYEWRK